MDCPTVSPGFRPMPARPRPSDSVMRPCRSMAHRMTDARFTTARKWPSLCHSAASARRCAVTSVITARMALRCWYETRVQATSMSSRAPSLRRWRRTPTVRIPAGPSTACHTSASSSSRSSGAQMSRTVSSRNSSRVYP